MKKLIILMIACFCIVSAHAAYLKNIPMTVNQPDGTVLHCFASGDEFFNYLHDENGYTIMRHPQTGYYVYAEKHDGQLVATEFVAGRQDPASKGLQPYALISPEEWMAKRRAWEVPEVRPQNRDYIPNHGTLNNISIFIRFSDDEQFTNSYYDIDNMFNDVSEGAVSLRSYFRAASYGAIEIPTTFYPGHNGETIISYQDTYPHNYFEPYDATTNPNGYQEDERTEREFALLERAVNYVNNNYPVPSNLNIDYDNDGYVDNVCFIVKGGVGAWSSLLWPHKWTLYGKNVYINGKRVWTFNFQLADASSYFNTSTMCHEMNHSLSAPDLYHYSYSGPDAVGIWDLMHENATPPQHCGAYMKMKYGHWIDEIPEITQAGTYTLNPISSPTSTNVAYKIPTEDPNQFYVLEYRDNTSLFETALPGSGLLIYRINISFNGNADYNPDQGIYDEVYIFRPGGSFSENGNLYTAHFSSDVGRTEFNASTSAYPFFTDGTIDNNFMIYNITNAGNTISFTYGSSSDCEPPTNLVATVEDNNVSLSWDAVANASSYRVYRNGNLVGNTSGTTYTDNNIAYGIYSYFVKSVDANGLLSTSSETVTLTIVPDGSIIIGGGNSTTNNYLPSYSYYNYSLTQQIYTADEIGETGVITSIAFYNGGAEKTRTYDLYLKNTTKNVFSSTTDWETVSDADKVFSGSVTMAANDWTIIVFNNPFFYDGTSNLVLVTDDNSGEWSNSPHMSCRVFDAYSQAIQIYNDNTNYNPNAPTSYTGTIMNEKNQLLVTKVAPSTTPVNIIVNANPVQGGTVSGGGEFNFGETCTVVATTNEGYTFYGWTENGVVVSNELEYSFTAIQNRNLVAEFIEGIMIGDGGTATNLYLPSYSYYNYTLSQQIYTAEELGEAGVITSIAFYNGGAEKTRTYDFYFVATDKASFSGSYDWEVVTEADKVFSGSVTMVADGWTYINLDTPYQYDGTSNLVFVADDNSGIYTNSPHMACRVFDAPSQAIRIYSDGTNYDPSNPSSYSGTVFSVKNQLLITKEIPSTDPLNVTVSANPVEGGTVSGGGEFGYEETCTVTATPNEGYFFMNWTENGTIVSSDANYTFTVISNRNLVANFAEGHEIGDGGTETNQYLPSYSFYNYTLSQQIYTAEELGEAGIITSIAFYNGGTEKTRTYDFYMVATDKTSFSGGSDWEVVTEADKVFSGSVTMAADDWTVIMLTNPFIYDGTTNVILAADDNTSSYSSGMQCRVFDAPSQAIRIFSDGTNYNPFAPANYNGTVMDVKNQLRITREGLSDCMMPTHLTATEVGPDFVVLSWTENGASEQWYVVYGNDYVVADTNESFLLEGLEPETQYTIMVRPVCDENLFSSSINITTLEACPIPQELEVGDITGRTATLSWTGYSDNYLVQVGIADFMIIEGFDNGIPADWANDVDYPWAIVDGHIQSGNAGVASSTSSISVTMTFPVEGTIEFDAECRGEGSSSIWDKCIFSIDEEAQFTNGANVSGWNHYTFDVMAGEHTFTWSYSKDGSVNPTGDYFAVDNVLMKSSETNWEEPISVANAQCTFTDLAPVTTYCVRVQGVCDGTESEWSEVVYFTTLEQTTITQTIALSTGWNWWSTNLEITLDNLKAALVEALPGTNITIKSKDNGQTNYNSTTWSGQLTTLDVAQMYRISVSAACEITLEGTPINLAEHPITISNGDNWIGFPLNESVSLSNTFNGFAVSGDVIKSKDNGIATYNGSQWRGTLNTLVPGQGYIYKSNVQENRTFTFPTSTR